MSRLVFDEALSIQEGKRPALTHRAPVFGLSITPDNVEKAFTLARAADELGLDIIGVQDHAYNGTFLDTWTLIIALATSTKKIRYFTV